MLPTKTMAYGADVFNFRRQALLKSKAPLDFTYETSIANLEVSGTEPEGCRRRIIFEVDGNLYRFGSSGLDLYDERGKFNDIIEYGNTVAEVLAQKDIKEWCGKRVYPIVAMDAPLNSPVMPKIKFAANVNSYNDIYTKYEYSPIISLKRTGDAAKIIAIDPSTHTNGHGIVTIWCKLCNPVTGWGDWIFTTEAANQLATAIQFRCQYVLTTLDGGDRAQVNDIIVNYTTDSDNLAALTKEIIIQPQRYYSDLGVCYALIKHSPLRDATIKAFVNFSKAGERRENVSLGLTTGGEQTIYLQYRGVVDSNVIADTIHLQIGGKTFSGFYFDTQHSSVTFTAEANQEIFGSWDTGLADELWREMSFDSMTESGGVCSSRFVFRLSDTLNKTTSAVKFVVERGNGSVVNEYLSDGTGKLQTFYLPHKARIETMSCTGSWKYDEVAQVLQVVAPIDAPIRVSYEWVADFPAVHEIICGWTPKV